MKPLIWSLVAAILPILALAGPAEDYDRGYALAQDKGCFECHALGRRDVGPSFSAIAARYHNDPDARQRLPYVIRGGSVGHWGERFAMWPQRQLSNAEVRLLVEWILAQ
jgi:cytochrome c